MRPRPGKAARKCRAGMTLLEVVLAIAALGLVAASATTTISYLYGTQVREERRLAAAELASRLVLIFLDDPGNLPPKFTPIPYARDAFRYELVQAPISLKPSDHVRNALAQRRGDSPIPLDRFEQITVRVWLAEDSGGAERFDASIPHAVLVRLFDPNFFNRNPDSGFKAFEDEQRRLEMFNRVLGGGA